MNNKIYIINGRYFWSGIDRFIIAFKNRKDAIKMKSKLNMQTKKDIITYSLKEIEVY